MRAIVIALGLCVALAGCGQKSEKEKTTTIDTNNGSVTVSGNGTHMVVKSDNGQSTVEYNAGGNVHADMPDFAPLYPGARVTASIAGSGNTGGKGAMVTISTPDAPDAVIAFYKKHAAAAGFTDKMTMNSGDSTMYVATKDKASLQVTASKTGDGTQVQVTWSNGQNI